MSPASTVLDGVTLGAAAAGGALSGSAAGAAVTRWAEGLTLGSPGRSRCDRCEVPVLMRDMVPVVSWVALGGRCRSCRAPIDRRQPTIELLATAVAVLVVAVHGPTMRGLLLTLGAVALLTASATDVAERIIPDRLTRPLAVLGLGGLSVAAAIDPVGPSVPGAAFAWAVGFPAALGLLTLAADRTDRARPIGGGDIKLLVGVLALAGLIPDGAPMLLLVTALLAGTVATVGLLAGRLHRRSRLPLAPAITGAYLLVVLAPSTVRSALSMTGGTSWAL